MAEIDLSHHKSYTGGQQQAEVQEFGPDIHDGICASEHAAHAGDSQGADGSERLGC